MKIAVIGIGNVGMSLDAAGSKQVMRSSLESVT